MKNSICDDDDMAAKIEFLQLREDACLKTRASERKLSRGYEGRYRAPKSDWAPQALSGPIPLNHFLSDGCRSSFKTEGITIYGIQLGPMKYTTRHKIGLNLARGCGGAL